MTNSLLGVLIRLRKDKIALAADVREMLRYKKYCMKTYLTRDIELSNNEIKVSEILDAERDIIRIVQMDAFKCDYDMLRHGNNVKQTSNLIKLPSVLDPDGIIRVSCYSSNKTRYWYSYYSALSCKQWSRWSRCYPNLHAREVLDNKRKSRCQTNTIKMSHL